MKKILASSFALAFTVSLAGAAAVTVTNPSFELDETAATGNGGWSDAAPVGWTDPNGNSNDNFVEIIGGFAADGVVHLGFNAPAASRNYVFQDLGVAWAPNTQYTYTVALGNRAGFGQADTLLGLGNDGSGTFVGSTTVPALSNTTEGTFQDFSFVYNTGAVAPSGNVTIYVENVGTTRTHLDNVRLDASPVPEVSSLGLLGAALGLISLRRRR